MTFGNNRFNFYNIYIVTDSNTATCCARGLVVCKVYQSLLRLGSNSVRGENFYVFFSIFAIYKVTDSYVVTYSTRGRVVRKV